MSNTFKIEAAARLKLTADGSTPPPKAPTKPGANRKFIPGKGWCVFKHGRGWVKE